jgi:hypothetical protein
MKYSKHSFKTLFNYHVIFSTKRQAANLTCKLLLSLMPKSINLENEFFFEEDVEFKANIEGLAARFYIKRHSYKKGLHTLTFSLNGDHSFYYTTPIGFSYGICDSCELPYQTPEGKKALETQAIAFVLKCVNTIPKEAVYCAVSSKDQRSFFKISDRLGFVRVGCNIFRAPLPEGGFLRVKPSVIVFFEFLARYSNHSVDSNTVIATIMKLAASSKFMYNLIKTT